MKRIFLCSSSIDCVYGIIFIRNYSLSMKPTLTRWGGLSNEEVFVPVHQQVELVGAMRLRPIGQTDLLHASAKDLIQSWRI